jgi:integrating conjugative element protein (TIGR03761 family)
MNAMDPHRRGMPAPVPHMHGSGTPEGPGDRDRSAAVASIEGMAASALAEGGPEAHATSSVSGGIARPRKTRARDAARKESGAAHSPQNPPTQSRSSEPSTRTAKPQALRRSAPDRLTLHTTAALNLFTGRVMREAAAPVRVAGARRFAGSMASIWELTARDNPYADWLLIRAQERLNEVCEAIDEVCLRLEASRVELERLGLSVCVMENPAPFQVPMAFRGPYGYAGAMAVVRFDRLVRLVQTLARADQLADREARRMIRESAHALRSVFGQTLHWAQALRLPALAGLCRADFADGATPQASARVQAAQARLGVLPGAVLSGRMRPMHRRRPARARTPEPSRGEAVQPLEPSGGA